MTDAIGPGSAVQYAGHDGTLPYGTVAFVLKILTIPNTMCSICGPVTHGYDLNIPIPDRHTGDLGWCANHWRPFSGPEQARVRVCEEVGV